MRTDILVLQKCLRIQERATLQQRVGIHFEKLGPRGVTV